MHHCKSHKLISVLGSGAPPGVRILAEAGTGLPTRSSSAAAGLSTAGPQRLGTSPAELDAAGLGQEEKEKELRSAPVGAHLGLSG